MYKIQNYVSRFLGDQTRSGSGAPGNAWMIRSGSDQRSEWMNELMIFITRSTCVCVRARARVALLYKEQQLKLFNTVN